MTLEWETPSPRKSFGTQSKYDWATIAAQLRANPGAWAKVFEDISASNAAAIKKGTIKAFAPAGNFDAVIRNVKGSRGTLYIRYIGPVVKP